MADDDPLAATLAAVLSRLGADIAVTLTQAQGRLIAMSDQGVIDRQGLRALDNEVDRTRRLGMRAQQLARLVSGTPLLTPERLSLGRLLQDILAEQAEQAGTPPDTCWRTSLQPPAEVIADPSLAATILRAAADWSIAHTQVLPVEWTLSTTPWPVRARIACRITHPSADARAPGDGAPLEQHPELDNLDWHALRLAAHLGRVEVRRESLGGHSTVWLEFSDVVQPAATRDDPLRDEAASGAPIAPLPAGFQLLLLANRREVRQLVRDALQKHDVFVDHVPNVAAAQAYCKDGAPQALLFETAFTGEALTRLCGQFGQSPVPPMLIEVLPEGPLLETGEIAGSPVLRMGIEALKGRLVEQLSRPRASRPRAD